MKQVVCEVVENFPVARETWLMRLLAPSVAAGFRPGQFLHLVTAEPGSYDPLLRRPISLLRGGGPRQAAAPPAAPQSWGEEATPATQPAGLQSRGVKDDSATLGNAGWRGPVPPPGIGGLGGLPASRPGPGEVDILLKTVGRGTEWLANRRPGDTVEALGPLGQPFPDAKPGQRLLLVGGGVGIVPLVAAADRAVAQGNEVVLAFGARSAADVPGGELLDPAVEYRVTTEDGSLGTRGYVTALLPELLPWADIVFACGPTPMLRAVAEYVRDPKHHIGRPKRTWLALEEHMGCAVGVCLGCVVETRHGYQRICREGPVFRADEIVW